MTARRCRGLVLAASGRVEDAAAELAAAVADHGELVEPYERARTLLALGTVERRARRKRAAREALSAAAEAFDGLGAVQWAARARDESARIGGRPPPRDALSVSERRVADLVVEGRSNREVAEALFLSRKTVEFHLRNVFRKLGVSSRTELARQIGAKTRDFIVSEPPPRP